MYIDGNLVTAGEKTRLHSDPFGVRVYDADQCDPGYTLFSPAWGDQEYLIDMRGLVVHTWKVSHSNVAEILPNGNLFTHKCGYWLEELMPDSKCIWRWEGTPDLAAPNHHDFWVGNNMVVTLAAVDEPVFPGLFEPGTEPDDVRTDLILIIDRQTRQVIWRFSFSDHLATLCELAGYPMPIPYKKVDVPGLLEPYGPRDWAHANTIEVLPATPLGKKDSRFREGNLLFSLRHLDIIGIVDPFINEIVWCYGPGVLDGQHQPTMLPNGNILVFDNGTFRGNSIVREIEPVSGQIVWEYENGTDFYSPFRSGNQRLPNGNTLICECDAGHLFEVTSDKEIVWDFWSPFVGQGPHHLGKRIHRATRYPPEAVELILRSRGDDIVAEVDRDGQHITNYYDLIQLYQS
jgi:hypothetical protein